MPFQIHALPAANFEPLFALSDEALAKRNIHRRKVTENPGAPCRVSLEDADVGDTVLLLNHAHLPEASPYSATHAIYVRQDVPQAFPRTGTVPDVIARRLISVRLFSADHMMVDADVLDGTDVGRALDEAFKNLNVDYVHLHNAKQGCFAAKATRSE